MEFIFVHPYKVTNLRKNFAFRETFSQVWKKITSLRYSNLFTKIFLLLFCFGLSLYLLGGLISAKWSVYADHELRAYRIVRPNLGLQDIPTILMTTEVGYPGQVSRYRPTTYLMFALESLFWGDNPTLLHLFRFVGFFLFFVFIVLTLNSFFSALLSAALAALLLTSTYWKHVWIGFGPNEQYIAFITPIFLWSYLRIFPKKHKLDRVKSLHFEWIICCLSAVLLAGVKENMTIVVFPLGWLGYKSWLIQRRIGLRLCLLITSCFLIGLIIAAIIVGLSGQGRDFYGASLTGSRISNLIALGTSYPFPLMVAISGVIGLLFIFFRDNPSEKWIQLHGMTSHLLPMQFGLLVLSLSHAFFYNGWPVDNRYAFPGQLYVFISVVFFLYLVLEVIGCLAGTRVRLATELFVSTVALCGILHYGYEPIRQHVSEFASASIKYSKILDIIVRQSRAQPLVPIVVESSSPYDLEPAFSINRFLISYGVTNPLFLRLHNIENAPYPDDGFFHGLIDTISQLSEAGDIKKIAAVGTLPSAFMAKYNKLQDLGKMVKDAKGQCFSVFLGIARNTECLTIGTIVY